MTGKLGRGPGEFMGPHAMALDSQGRIFVADRSNNRVQIFDQDLNYLDSWKHFGRPSGILEISRVRIRRARLPPCSPA